MQTCLLCEIDELPALLEVHGAWYFDGCVLAVEHGALCYGEVVIPVCGYVYEVDVRTLAELFVAFLAVVYVGRLQAFLAHVFLAAFGACFFVVTEGYYFYAWDITETHYCPRASHTETYEAYAHGLNLRCFQTKGMLLPCGACWCFDYDCALVPMPLCAW